MVTLCVLQMKLHIFYLSQQQWSAAASVDCSLRTLKKLCIFSSLQYCLIRFYFYLFLRLSGRNSVILPEESRSDSHSVLHLPWLTLVIGRGFHTVSLTGRTNGQSHTCRKLCTQSLKRHSSVAFPDPSDFTYLNETCSLNLLPDKESQFLQRNCWRVSFVNSYPAIARGLEKKICIQCEG